MDQNPAALIHLYGDMRCAWKKFELAPGDHRKSGLAHDQRWSISTRDDTWEMSFHATPDIDLLGARLGMKRSLRLPLMLVLGEKTEQTDPLVEHSGRLSSSWTRQHLPAIRAPSHDGKDGRY